MKRKEHLRESARMWREMHLREQLIYVREEFKVITVLILRVSSAMLEEWAYQLGRLSHVIETPRVVRDAESELLKASIMEELEQDDLGWDEEEDFREWWLRDPDNRDDR